MSASKFLPVPILIAILAFIWVTVATKFSLLSWVAFLTWGGYFLTGMTTKSAIREAISFTLGIGVGVIVVLAATMLTPALGANAFPVVVAAVAFVIVYLELVPWFDMAPMYFIAAAAFFAAGGKPDLETSVAVFIPGMLGLALGVLTVYLRGMLLNMTGATDTNKS